MSDFDLPGGRIRNPGGTRGGFAEFAVGLAMLIAGGYLFMDNVVVTGTWGGAWSIGGYHLPFGLALLPLFAGIIFLFFNSKSVIGWVLTIGGAITIFVGVIARLGVDWRPTSLYTLIIILVLIAGGIGLIARAIRAH